MIIYYMINLDTLGILLFTIYIYILLLRFRYPHLMLMGGGTDQEACLERCVQALPSPSDSVT